MKEVTPSELHFWKESGKRFQLIDVREEYEVAYCSIGGQHIPMSEIISHADILPSDIPVVFHCQSGKRSAAVVYALEHKLGKQNLYTLKGGVMAWGDQVDPGLECFR